MVIETTACFQRLARSAAWFLFGALSLCGVAAAQTPPAVTIGSVIPLQHAMFGQIYKILYWQGNILMLDTATSVIYQIAPGSTTFTTIATGSETGPLSPNNSYGNIDMAIDNEGNLYISERYPASTSSGLFWRVPYNAASGSWDLTAADGWGANIATSGGANLLSEGSDCMAFLDSGAGDGSGTLYWMTELAPAIYQQQVGAGGTLVGPAVPIVTGLMVDQGRMTVDANGNIYFLENPGTSPSGRVTGVFFIPAGITGISAPSGTAVESLLTNLIPASYNSTNKFNGVSLDPTGNLYFTSESDSTGGTLNGVLMIPNSCGNSQNAVYTASCYNWNNVSYIAPVASNEPLMVDPRGFLWIPSYQAWSYPGSSTYGGPVNTTTGYCTGGACNIVLWAMGSDNLGASPVGTAITTPGTVFVNFNDSETLGSIGFSQPGTASDFVTTTTNPYPDSTATTPTTACATGSGTTGPGPYAALTSCPVWVAMTPQTAGPISGQLVMTDSSGNPISGNTTYLSGVGQGPMAALLGITQQTAMAATANLVAPAQVAVDTLGNVYVADPTLGTVLEYKAGSVSASGTKVYGPGKPTGVAVDGSGDVYIGDSGSIYEIPFVNGKLNTTGQTTLVTSNAVSSDIPPNFSPLPLGDILNLAVDGSGDVYAADPDDAQVVKIDNPASAMSQTAYSVVGTGFKAPSAVAIDNFGDLFVADGNSLYEITPWGLQTTLDTTLSSPVTGLTVEPSGSIDVAQKGGILRIPSLGGSFTVNDAMPLDTAMTVPTSVAIDTQGNLYVTDETGGMPNLYQLSINGAFDFGQVSAFLEQEQDVSVYNVGNEPLSFANDIPSFSDAADFSLTGASYNPCDTTGATTVESGSSCDFGVQIDAQSTGNISGNMFVTSSAANGAVTARFAATSVNTLEPTTVAINNLSTTTTTFPGSAVATVTITPAPLASVGPTTNVPSGAVMVTLTSTVQGSTHPPIVFMGQASGTDAGTTATINLTSLPGGAYLVTAKYEGNTNFGGGTATTTLVVAPATPAIAVSEPSAVQPNSANGVYYVLTGSNTTVTVTVTSTLGTPTGTVTFMNGSQPADPTQVNQPLNADGQVTFNVENLAAGIYKLVADYSGDSNFAVTPSAPVAFDVIPPSVLISASPASVSTSAGTPVMSTLTLQSLVGFAAPGGVNITCNTATVPSYSECTFNNPQPALSSGGSTTTVVTLSTNIPTNIPASVGIPPAQPSLFALAGLFGLGLLGLGLRKRKLISRGFFKVVSLTLLLAGSIVAFTGCTNSSYTHTPQAPHYITPAGTYNVSVIVTDEATGKQYSLPFTMGVTVQ